MRIRKLFGGLVLAVAALVAVAVPASAAEGNVKGHAEEECIHILEEGGSIDA